MRERPSNLPHLSRISLRSIRATGCSCSGC